MITSQAICASFGRFKLPVSVVPVLKPVRPGAVRVYHCMYTAGWLKSVRAHGLLTSSELYRRGLTRHDPSKITGLLQDQFNVIYFRWMLRPPTSGIASVGFDVDPYKTYVYNSDFRADKDQAAYDKSKTLLSSYLAGGYAFSNEIIVPAACIPPEELIFPEQNACRKL